MNSIYEHENDKRILIEWIENTPFCSTKAIIAKTDSPIGGHYHKEKNEIFLLLKGKAKRVIIGKTEQRDVKAPHLWECPKGTYHLFELKKKSILLGAADKPFDSEDEHNL